MLETQLYINSHAVDAIKALAHPEAIIAFIGSLKSNPSTVGDYRQPDPHGRMIEVKVLGRHAVLFFTDPFANLIKVLDVRHMEGI